MQINDFGSFYKHTTEDWAPSFRLCTPNYHNDKTRLLRVHMFRYESKRPYLYRICVWGADDTGMELDTKDRIRAMDALQAIIRVENVSKQSLVDLGFIDA